VIAFSDKQLSAGASGGRDKRTPAKTPAAGGRPHAPRVISRGQSQIIIVNDDRDLKGKKWFFCFAAQTPGASTPWCLLCSLPPMQHVLT